jgi:hypothetical protein
MLDGEVDVKATQRLHDRAQRNRPSCHIHISHGAWREASHRGPTSLDELRAEQIMYQAFHVIIRIWIIGLPVMPPVVQLAIIQTLLPAFISASHVLRPSRCHPGGVERHSSNIKHVERAGGVLMCKASSQT